MKFERPAIIDIAEVLVGAVIWLLVIDLPLWLASLVSKRVRNYRDRSNAEFSYLD